MSLEDCEKLFAIEWGQMADLHEQADKDAQTGVSKKEDVVRRHEQEGIDGVATMMG